MNNYTSLGVDDLRRQESTNIWVINNSARIANMQDGSVVFQVTTGPGEYEVIHIPYTWVPINIGMQIAKEHIIKSTNFLRAHRGKSIIVINDATAEKILQASDARVEHDRMTALMEGINYDNIGEDYKNSERQKEEEQAAADKDFSNVHAKVYEVVKRDGVSESEQLGIITQLFNLGVIKDEETRFIMDNSEFDKVKTFITNSTKQRSRN